jgi:hypothetical protein
VPGELRPKDQASRAACVSQAALSAFATVRANGNLSTTVTSQGMALLLGNVGVNWFNQSSFQKPGRCHRLAPTMQEKRTDPVFPVPWFGDRFSRPLPAEAQNDVSKRISNNTF